MASRARDGARATEREQRRASCRLVNFFKARALGGGPTCTPRGNDAACCLSQLCAVPQADRPHGRWGVAALVMVGDLSGRQQCCAGRRALLCEQHAPYPAGLAYAGMRRRMRAVQAHEGAAQKRKRRRCLGEGCAQRCETRRVWWQRRADDDIAASCVEARERGLAESGRHSVVRL